MKLSKWLLVPCLALTMYTKAPASDIYIGRRGPTDWQLDQRVVSSENEKARSTTSTTILKYWDGDEHGKWWSVSLPYKHLEPNAPAPTQNGFGDLSLNLGPRGRNGNFHWFLYSGLTLPTGGMGNDRTDMRFGGLFTQMSPDQKYEVDGSIDYNITGTDRNGIDPPDEFSAGILLGGEVAKNTRAAAGLTYLGKGNDHSTNMKTVFRFTPSKKAHFELTYETPVSSRGIPRTSTICAIGRYNF
ncbi:MAG: transporter [Candidatus Aenigmarchaeota archaeon]|nr:transporter [Candidatus Aenigmarchaeota archaeon]